MPKKIEKKFYLTLIKPEYEYMVAIIVKKCL